MIHLENALYRSEQIRACEQLAMQLQSLDEHQLMAQAGSEAFLCLQKFYPKVRHLAVYCGSGNNAGDGYVLARIAHEQGYSVIIYHCTSPEHLPQAAQHAAQEALAAGVEFQCADEPLDMDTELIVDALLGIGLKGAVYGSIAHAIEQINASGLPVLSLDIPSGLNADTGLVVNVCVKAETTLTFIAKKIGMYTLDGPDYCGVIHCCPLKLKACLAKVKPEAFLLDYNGSQLPKRKKNSHKADYGSVLVIGSGPGMPGAVSLVARAAMRVGAGSVHVATWPQYAMQALPLIPEAMVWGVHGVDDLEPLLSRARVCVIGPGLGESEWAQELFSSAMTAQLPMIIDASALRLLALQPQLDDNWILTPHPGEAGSLLSCTTEQIQEDRAHSAAAIQQQYGGVVVLKGVGTFIHTLEKQTFICSKGNPGMASAGMGDVLSGIIAGLCAQGLSLSEAAKFGVWAHALAAENAALSFGERGLLASDLMNILPTLLN